MNVLIVEDEKPASDRLRKMINKIAPNFNIVAITQSVEETVNWIKSNNNPQLIFMDIQLDDGLCFEIFDTISLDIPIIFTTAFNEYTLRAFKVNSIDYLLKPIDEDELYRAINKYNKITTSYNIEQQLKQAISSLNTSFRNRFLIKVGANFKSIAVKDISLFFIESKSVFIYTNKERTFAIDFTLDHIKEMIDPTKFYRINRSCIVNIDYITQLTTYSSSRLQIAINNFKNKEILVVSRDKVTDFKNWLNE